MTTDTQIYLQYNALVTDVETGGSTILSYNLQMDDGAGLFHDVYGVETNTLSLQARVNATKGVKYAFRYRAKNVYGWSGFSPVTYILAAASPSKPPRPHFI